MLASCSGSFILALFFYGPVILVGSACSAYILLRSISPKTCYMLLDHSKAHRVRKRYLVFQIMTRRIRIGVVGWTVRDPPETSSMLQLPLSDENRIHRNIHLFQAQQLGEFLLLSHEVVHIGVRRQEGQQTYTLRSGNQFEKPWDPTFPDVKIIVLSLFRTIPACQKILITTDLQVEVLMSYNVQEHHTTDHPYPFMQSSSHPWKRDSTVGFLHVRGQHSIC